MDAEPPASPDAVPPPASPSDDVPRIAQEEVEMAMISADLGAEYAGVELRPTHGYNSPEFQARYTDVARAYDKFYRISTMGDVTQIYRNRAIWVNMSEEELQGVAVYMITHVPSTKTAILTYIGLLIHENANMFFSKKENPHNAVNYSSVQGAAVKLLDTVRDMVQSAQNEQFLLDVLKWCCDLAFELSEKNNGRPLMSKCHTPEMLLSLFLTCPSVKEMISVMDFTINQLLLYRPEDCMSALFYASRHGSHFNWIWLHIADTFPGKVVENIFTIGGQQFKAYVDTIQAKKRAQVSAHILDQIHQEYNVRFISLSAVFNFLMRRGNIELRNIVSKMITESLDQDSKENVNWNIVFFFKLVTVSVDTLRFLVAQNAHLATPLNFYRGIRQIMSLDKEMILPMIGYAEFCHQMIHVLDMQSQCVVFKVVARLALDSSIFAGADPKDAAVIKAIRDGALIGLDDLLGIMVRAVHSTDTLNPNDQNAVGTFATGRDLQFIIDTALANPNVAPLVIRYLHAVSMAFSELKAAEIASRLLFACSERQLERTGPKAKLAEPQLHVFCAFLSTVVPFYPHLMVAVYKNLASFRAMYLTEAPVCDDSEERRSARDIVLISNIRTLLEWELNEKEFPFLINYDLNPRDQLGILIRTTLSLCIDTSARELKAKRMDNVHLISMEVGKFLRALSPPMSSQTGKAKLRTVFLPVRYSYTMAVHLAYLLKVALCAVSIDDHIALSFFEELRASIVLFYTDHCHRNQRNAYQLFFTSFLTHSMMENCSIFGDEAELDPWKDEDELPEKEDDEDYSFLEAMKRMDIRQQINRLAHSGTIGKGARHLIPTKSATNDQMVRCHVFLDAVRSLCHSHQNSAINTRLLAQFLVELLCQDSVAGDMFFQDWDLERESVSKFLVVQRIERSWICRGLMEVVAETKPCFWYCLPLVRAQLSTIMMKLLSSTDKSAKVSNDLIDKIDQWIVMVRKGNLVPQRFEHFMDILPHISAHEAFLLMHDFWRYFQRRSVTLNTLDSSVKTGAINGLEPDDYRGDYATCKLVILRHSAELGPLFLKMFADEVKMAEERVADIEAREKKRLPEQQMGR